jgi:hypothetical protein
MKPFKHAPLSFDDSDERDGSLWIASTILLEPKRVLQLYKWLGKGIASFRPKPKSTAAKKAKGRAACDLVREALMKWAPDLRPGDIETTSSGACGEDLKLSPAAREIYNYAWEVKCQESLNIWSALEQAESHAEGTERTPILAFKRNRTELFVALKLEDFLKLTR